VAAGALLKFDAGVRLWVGGSTNQGSLVAVGTIADPILFTTSNPTPAAGQWRGIAFENGTVDATSILDRVVVDYAGNFYNIGVQVSQSAPIIRNTTVRNTFGSGIYFSSSPGTGIDGCTITTTGGYGVEIISSGTVGVRTSTITGTGNYGIHVSSSNSGTFDSNVLDKGLKFTSPLGNPVITANTLNNYDAWPAQVGADDVGELLGSNTINGATSAGRLDVLGEALTANATWPKKVFPYIIKSSSVTIGNSTTVPVTLTVAAGALLKFDSSIQLLVGGSSNKGSLVAVGTGVEPVVFTTSNPTPAAGQWRGISFENGTVDATSLLDMVVVQYAGQTVGAGVIATSSSPTIRNSTISSNSGHGLSLQSSAANIQFNNVSSNTQYGIQASSSSNSVIQHNNFAGNTLGAISSTTAPAMDARFNWYGSASGPGGSGPGTGQSVSTNVGFDPWQMSAAEPSHYFQEAYLSTPTFRPGSFARFFVQVPRRSTWTLKVFDVGGSLVRTYTGPNDAYFQVDWDGRNGSGVAQPDGTYRYQIEAVDNHESLVAAPVTGRVALDATYAVGELSSPGHLLTFGIGSPVIVEGTAGGSGFLNYVVQAAPGVFPSSTSWVNVSPTVSSPVNSGVLGTWNTAGFNNGLYTMRLLVTNTLTERTAVNLGVLVLSINSLTRDRIAFSPNGDGSRDTVTISSVLSVPSDWTISIYDAVTSNGIRTYTGYGSSVDQTWDGLTGGGVTAPEALYRFELLAASGGTSVQSSITSTIDLTPPIASISAPAAGANVYNIVPIDGTSNDPGGQHESYQLEYGLGASPPSFTPIGSAVTTPVVSGRLGNWTTNDLEGTIPVVNGTATLRLASIDWAGNTASVTRLVNLDNLFISNVTATPRTIDTFLGGQSTISFTLNRPAFVSIGIEHETSGADVWGFEQTYPAGTSTVIWDGHDIAEVEVPDESYVFSLDADAGSGRTDRFAPTVPGPPGSISGTVDPSYNPYTNDFWSTTVALATASRVTLQMDPAGTPPQFDVFTNRPYAAGTFPIVWDGRDATGAIITVGSAAYFPQPISLKTNYLLVTGSTPEIAGIHAVPYKMAMSYDNVASLNFQIERNAVVTLTIMPPGVNNPDDPRAVRIWDGVPAGDGDYEVLFDPVNIAISGEDTMLFSDAGAYTFAVKAVNASNGATMLRRGIVNIER
jgi:parallel beta-helix repeat protein